MKRRHPTQVEWVHKVEFGEGNSEFEQSVKVWEKGGGIEVNCGR